MDKQVRVKPRVYPEAPLVQVNVRIRKSQLDWLKNRYSPPNISLAIRKILEEAAEAPAQ